VPTVPKTTYTGPLFSPHDPLLVVRERPVYLKCWQLLFYRVKSLYLICGQLGSTVIEVNLKPRIVGASLRCCSLDTPVSPNAIRPTGAIPFPSTLSSDINRVSPMLTNGVSGRACVGAPARESSPQWPLVYHRVGIWPPGAPLAPVMSGLPGPLAATTSCRTTPTPTLNHWIHQSATIAQIHKIERNLQLAYCIIKYLI